MDVKHDERRRYFRVSDLIGMSYRFLAADELDLNVWSVPLNSQLAQLEQQIESVLMGMQTTHPELGKLLALYNQKINLALGQGMTDQGQNSGQAMHACQVNLSACGIAFPAAESAELNQHLALDLTIYPSKLRLNLIAAVIACDDDQVDGHPYLIRANFVNISEYDQELLIQHVIKRQAQQLKELREIEP